MKQQKVSKVGQVAEAVVSYTLLGIGYAMVPVVLVGLPALAWYLAIVAK